MFSTSVYPFDRTQKPTNIVAILKPTNLYCGSGAWVRDCWIAHSGKPKHNSGEPIAGLPSSCRSRGPPPPWWWLSRTPDGEWKVPQDRKPATTILLVVLCCSDRQELNGISRSPNRWDHELQLRVTTSVSLTHAMHFQSWTISPGETSLQATTIGGI